MPILVFEISSMLTELLRTWFPYIHCIALAVNPTTIIGLDEELKMVSGFKYTSNAPPAVFSYPPKTLPPEKVCVSCF